MGSKRRRRYGILCVVLGLFLVVGCTGLQPRSDQDRITKLEHRVVNLEILLGAEVGANFFPASGFYGAGPTAGNCDYITSTADGDKCFVVLHDHASLGDALVVYVLDADSACGGDDTSVPPLYFQAADGGDECWELAGNPTLQAVVNDPDNFATAFTGPNLKGGTFIANAAGTAAFPAVTAGMSFTYILQGANANIVDPNAADTFIMNGLSAAQDENLTSSTSGAMCVFQYQAANTWTASCNGFAEATPP